MDNISNKVIAITGADGGMGREILKKLSKYNVKLALCSNNTNLNDLKDIVNTENSLIKTVDVTNEQNVIDFFADIKSKFGQADYLLNLAGLSIPAKIWETVESVYDSIIDVNLKGTFLCCKHFIPLVNTYMGGKIINIGSKAARLANGNAPIYCTAKCAVNMFSESLLIQSKEKNIQVTTLNPSGTDTAFWGDRPIDKSKFMQASDIAEIVEFVLNLNNKVVITDMRFESFS